MPYIVSTADVEARWRPLSDDESALAAVLIEDLTNDLDLARPDLADALADLYVDKPAKATAMERVITRVIAEKVKQALRNPDSLRSFSAGADGSISVGYDNGDEALANAGVGLNRFDLAAIDNAWAAATGLPQRTASVKLQAYPERYPVPDLTILPLP